MWQFYNTYCSALTDLGSLECQQKLSMGLENGYLHASIWLSRLSSKIKIYSKGKKTNAHT